MVPRMLSKFFNWRNSSERKHDEASAEVPSKKVALFGGSFNPIHPGHIEAGKFFHEELGVDEVWFLFSINTHKDPKNYESPEALVEMGEMLKKHYPDMPFIMSTVQHELGTHITYEVLEELSRRNPDTQFTWVMGADNLLRFHEWENYDDIIENYPLAIIDRAPYTEQAMQSYTILSYPHLMRSSKEELQAEGTGWHFFEAPKMELSSSAFLKQLRNGQREFEGPLQEIADHIVEKGLYGIKDPQGNAGLHSDPSITHD
jgi:nicotinate-nucleotide adenylyltransferase